MASGIAATSAPAVVAGAVVDEVSAHILQTIASVKAWVGRGGQLFLKIYTLFV